MVRFQLPTAAAPLGGPCQGTLQSAGHVLAAVTASKPTLGRYLGSDPKAHQWPRDHSRLSDGIVRPSPTRPGAPRSDPCHPPPSTILFAAHLATLSEFANQRQWRANILSLFLFQQRPNPTRSQAGPNSIPARVRGPLWSIHFPLVPLRKVS